MIPSVNAWMQSAAQDYVYRKQSENAPDRSKLPPVTSGDPYKYGGKDGDTVTVFNHSGYKPFSIRWKKAPAKAPRLLSAIASAQGKIDRARIEPHITEKERRSKIAAYTRQRDCAKRELSAAYAAEPSNIVVVES